MNVQKVYAAVYAADVPFDSEVSDKDFICQQAVNHVRSARLTHTTASSRITRGR